MELWIVVISYQIDILLSHKWIFIRSECLYNIGAFVYLVSSTCVGLAHREQCFNGHVLVQSICTFPLNFKVEHRDVHLIVIVFVEDIERSPVISIVFKASIFIIRTQSATCSQCIREGVDIEVTLENTQGVILTLWHCTWSLLRTHISLCGKCSSELITYIKSVLYIGCKAAHLVGNCPTRIIVKAY